jgi:hypothetical protein
MGLPPQSNPSVAGQGSEEANKSEAGIAVDYATGVGELSRNDDRLETLRKPERDRVEGLMCAAKTDFELWAVLETEVFPLITKLGLEAGLEKDTLETPESPAARKGGKKAKRGARDSPSLDHDGPDRTSVELDSPNAEVSPLEFYGPLYPSYLLLGLRLLDRSFAKPSALALAILPEIKSRGIISHVLGASAQLYNELLLIHWYRHDDFRGVLSLLSEMEQIGLGWEKETWDIVNDITRMQHLILRGDRGETLKALWSLPEFAPGRFKAWKIKIGRALRERDDQDVPQLAQWQSIRGE